MTATDKFLFFPSNFVLSKFRKNVIQKNVKSKAKFERTSFLIKTNFERTRNKFWKNVIRSNDLSRANGPWVVFNKRTFSNATSWHSCLSTCNKIKLHFEQFCLLNKVTKLLFTCKDFKLFNQYSIYLCFFIFSIWKCPNRINCFHSCFRSVFVFDGRQGFFLI